MPILPSSSDETFRKNESRLIDENTPDVVYAKISENLPFDNIIPWKNVYDKLHEQNKVRLRYRHPKPVSNEFIEKELELGITNAIKKFKKNHDKYINNLVRIFEMKKNAEQYARSFIAKTGSLNLTKMHQYKYNDDIFKKVTIVPGGKNHGLLMYVDFSGSMTAVIRAVMEQAAILAVFCKRVNIPFRVVGFTSGNRTRWHLGISNDNLGDTNQESDTKIINGEKEIFAFEIFSDKMKLKVFNEMLYLFASTRNSYSAVDECISMEGTPLDTMILMTPKLIENFRKETNTEKISVIILTDGGSTESLFNTMHGSYVVIQTPWSRKSHTMPASVGKYHWENGKFNTKFLLDIVRETTGATFIGYHLLTGKAAAATISEYQHYTGKGIDDLKNDFRSKYFFTVPNFGFDEYFFVWDRAMKAKNSATGDGEIDSNEEKGMQLEDGLSNKSLAKEFTKLKVELAKSRIFATKFMQLISS